MGVGKRQKRTRRGASCVLSRYIPPGGNPRDSCSLLLTYPNSPRPPAAPPPPPRPFRANVFRSSPFSRSFSAPMHLRGGKEACPREKRVCAFLRVNAPPRGGYAALVFSLFLSTPHPQALSSPGRISLSSSSNPRYSFTYVRAIYRLRQRARESRFASPANFLGNAASSFSSPDVTLPITRGDTGLCPLP